MSGRWRRVAETDRARVRFRVNGRPAEALKGDTVMTAVLTNAGHLRASEFGDGRRAGFCVMGACQDCWVDLADGRRLRACTAPIEPDMDVVIG